MSKLFVSNFPESYSEDNISLIFSPFGEIKSIKLVNDSKTFAIVEFETSEQSKAAADALRGRKLHGCQESLHVEPAFDRRKRVVVSNIPEVSSKDILMSFFGYYGPVDNITFCDDSRTIFVDFKLQGDAERLLELDKKINLGEKENRLVIKPFTKREEREKVDSSNRCIFIYNLSPKTTETDISDSFSKFGEISSSGVLSGGKGFINYERELSALKAIRHMDGKKLGGNKIRVSLKSMKKKSA